jgi:hypothetical protein
MKLLAVSVLVLALSPRDARSPEILQYPILRSVGGLTLQSGKPNLGAEEHAPNH